MSKKIKSRKTKCKTKYTERRRLGKHISTACVKTLNEMRIINSSVHSKIEQQQYDLLRILLKNNTSNGFDGGKNMKDLDLGILALNLDLKETRRDWQYWAAVFTQDDEITIGCEVSAGHIMDMSIGEFTDILPLIVKDTADNASIGRPLTYDEIKGWSWIIAPSDYCDLEGSSDNLIAYLVEEHDIMNQEKRVEVFQIQQSKIQPLEKILTSKELTLCQ